MNENLLFSHKKEYLIQLVLDGFISAMYSHKTLFKTLHSEKETQGLTIALAYLTEAHNYFINAQTLLADNVELFDTRSEFEAFFHRFSVYNKELLTNARTDHSHQWTDIEYREFAKSFKLVSGLLNIDQEDYWYNKALSSSEE